VEKELAKKFSAILHITSDLKDKNIKKATKFYTKNGYKLVARSRLSDVLFKRLKR
jgi:hypothetical protein